MTNVFFSAANKNSLFLQCLVFSLFCPPLYFHANSPALTCSTLPDIYRLQ